MCATVENGQNGGDRALGEEHASKVTKSNSNPTCCLATYAHLPTL